MGDAEIVALVMAGGSGTRFWPSSKAERPKQFLQLLSDRSLIQGTIDRIAPLIPADHTYICSVASQQTLLHEQLPEIKNLILEPAPKNTAPCLMLSLLQLLKTHSPQTVMLVLPADHHVEDAQGFLKIVEKAAALARQTKGLITLGIIPTEPHTGYGYIEAGTPEGIGSFHVSRFIEKPDLAKAEGFLRQGGFYWNSGIFIWTLKALAEAFETFLPVEWNALKACRDTGALHDVYRSLPALPIDIAVMEKSKNTFTIPCQIGWSDVGSWNALYQLQKPDDEANLVQRGNVRSVESKRCLVNVDPALKIALVGVEDLIIVESEGTLLIARRDKDQLVREAARAFET